jgi:hypothetical protein
MERNEKLRRLNLLRKKLLKQSTSALPLSKLTKPKAGLIGRTIARVLAESTESMREGGGCWLLGLRLEGFKSAWLAWKCLLGGFCWQVFRGGWLLTLLASWLALIFGALSRRELTGASPRAAGHIRCNERP